MGFSTAEVRPYFDQAFKELFGRLPNTKERQMLMAQAMGEGGYGGGWITDPDPGDGSNYRQCAGSLNWGAVQSKNKPVGNHCPPGSCMYPDHHKDGSLYWWCYKTYPSHKEAAKDFIRTALRTQAARDAAYKGNITAYSAALYHQHYYGALPIHGAATTDADRINWYGSALEKNSKIVAQKLGQKWALYRPKLGGYGRFKKKKKSKFSKGAPLLLVGALGYVGLKYLKLCRKVPLCPPLFKRFHRIRKPSCWPTTMEIQRG